MAQVIGHRLAEFGEHTMLITVDADNRPHVVTAVIRTRDQRLATQIDNRTATNLASSRGRPNPAGSTS
jgi:hypothetical protein